MTLPHLRWQNKAENKRGDKMIQVTCQVGDYSWMRKENLKIHNHCPHNNLVELEVGDKKYVVDGNDLKKAIDNCMNTGF